MAIANHDHFRTSMTPIHQEIAELAKLQPDAAAVSAWDGDLSRGELDGHAKQVARRLHNLGVGPEVCVGFCLPKSKWAVVAILGILQAGGVVVPIGPDHPPSRVQAILHTTKLQTVLTTSYLQPEWTARVSQVVPISDEFLSSSAPATFLPSPEGCLQQAAFIIHTSGSTGTPKGVVIEHGNLVTSLRAHGQRCGMHAGTRTGQFAHFTFDAAIHDIGTTLLFGGCVCMPSDEDRLNDLAGAMHRMRVTHALLSPRVLQTLRPLDCPHMRTVLVGGEAVHQEHFRHWIQPGIQVFIIYGPTEATIITTVHEVDKDTVDRTIGKAVAGNLWVVDEADPARLMPKGAVGELLIEGSLVAREYQHYPARTAAAFIESPVWRKQVSTPSAVDRFYRTGDLVRQTNDGVFVYIGRKDDQIKINGQRVELGEIEHHLLLDPAIWDAVVVYLQKGPSKGRLVAIVSLTDSTVVLNACLTSIRTHLQSNVPAYMVPHVWISQKTLPRNQNDKVDRRRLTEWLEAMDTTELMRLDCGSLTDSASEHSNHPLEVYIQRACAEVLQQASTSLPMNRSFISLGGDSITAMQLVSRCTRQYGFQLRVPQVMKAASIRDLVRQINITPAKRMENPSEESWFELSPIQTLYLECMAPRGLDVSHESRFNQSMCLAIRKPMAPLHLHRALEVLVERHAMLRARFCKTDEGWRQRIFPTDRGSFQFEVHKVVGSSQSNAVMLAAQQQLSLLHGPVFSAHWIEMSSTRESFLFLVASHMVVDFVSWHIIVGDLEALLHPSQSVLLSPILPFSRWLRHLTRHIQEERWTPDYTLPHSPTIGHWRYWGLTSEANCFKDRESEGFELNDELTSLLFSGHLPSRIVPVDVLLASLFHSFHNAFPDRTVPAIFNEGHGRESWSDDIDMSGTVGWFTTITPIQVPVCSGNDIITTLRRIKDTRRGIPENGLAYFASRYLRTDGRDAFVSHQHPEIVLNFTGSTKLQTASDGLFSVLQGPSPFDIGMDVRFPSVFDISASVIDDRLQVSFHFNRRISRRDAVHRWVRTCQSTLQNIVRRLQYMPDFYTPSDFPRASFTDEELGRLQTDLLPRAGISRPDDLQDIYPCSPIQQGILVSQIKDPTTYQVKHTWEMTANSSKAPMNWNRLKHAWQAVVARHDTLRTIFIPSASSQSQFYQAVRRDWRSSISHISCPKPEAVVVASAGQERPQWAVGEPHYQLTVYESAAGPWYLQLDFSHALMDASSLSIVSQDLVHAYDETLPLQVAPSYGYYVDYLQQQPSTDESLGYWTTQLAGAAPSYIPKSCRYSGASAWQTVQTKFKDMQSLEQFREMYGVTFGTLLQLAWAVVLARYSSNPDVLFGYMSNGRDIPLSGVDQIVGPLINVMVVRLSPECRKRTVIEAARHLQDNFLDSFTHQRTSLADIQHALHLPERALFNTSVSYQPTTSTPPTGKSITLKSTEGEETTEYDINLRLLGTKESLTFLMRYSSSWLDSQSAQRLLHSLHTALSSILANSHASLDEINVIPQADMEKLLQWNAHFLPPVSAFLHDEISYQARLRPLSTAVSGWEGDMTYRDLDRWSNALAQQLTNHKVGPEVIVGLYFEKSQWMIVSLLAVLKAGGVALPLGIQLPEDRLRHIIGVTHTSIVLSSPSRVSHLDDLPQIEVWPVDHDLLARLHSQCNKLPRRSLVGDNAAVVLYTSGSTGSPKGVVLTHQSMATSLEHIGSRLNVGPTTRALHFASYLFDLSLLELLAPLRCGGCVCVVSEVDRMDMLALTTAMSQMEVNWALLTSTVANLLDPAAFPSLKTLTFVGEAAIPASVSRWTSHMAVYIGYGPAEGTILTTIHGPLHEPPETTNIGRPLTEPVWVVDPDNHHCLVPLGAVGELLIEGPFLARGYLHDPLKTSRAFIYDPRFLSRCKVAGHESGARPGRRMYRTGDLVHQDPIDGSLVFVGRSDGQVKIHGQRVELPEIESRVYQLYPEAQGVAAVLVNPPGQSGETRLAVVLEIPGQSSDTTLFLPTSDSLGQSFREIQRELSLQFPSFMIPVIFIPVARMPVNPSGKLDRRCLQTAVDGLSALQLAQYALIDDGGGGPETSTESRLCDLWTNVLSPTRTLGRESHFFRSGGDSVSAMRLAAAAQALQPSLPLHVSDIFQNPVLFQMARAVDESDLRESVENAIPRFSLMGSVSLPVQKVVEFTAAECGVSQSSIEDIYPCTPLQEEMMAITARRPGAWVSRLVFRLTSSIDQGHFQVAWNHLQDLAPILRTRIVQYPQVGTAQVVIRESQQWEEIPSDLASYIAYDSAHPMGYGTPLVRWAIVRDSSLSFFVWSIHHSVYDGWTLDKLLDAFRRLYQAQAVPSFVPYNRFIQTLQQSPPQVADYWRSQLSGGRTPSFPEQSPGYRLASSQIITRCLSAKCELTDVTSATLLRATWALVIAQETNYTHVEFPIALSGRTSPVNGILDIIGPTLTIVPVHIDVDYSQSLENFLATVHQQAIDMIPYEHTGLAHIARLLSIPSLKFNNLFLVQPPWENMDHPLPGLDPVPIDLGEFHAYPLVMSCKLKQDGSIELVAHFDPFILSHSRMDTLLRRFDHVFQQLRRTSLGEDASQLLLRDIDFALPEDCDFQLMRGTVSSVIDQSARRRRRRTGSSLSSVASNPSPAVVLEG